MAHRQRSFLGTSWERNPHTRELAPKTRLKAQAALCFSRPFAATSELSLNWSTKPRSCVDICASDCAAFIDSCALDDVPCAALATPDIFCEISVEPFAASVTFRDISFVVALCSSTAVAMVLDMSLSWLMTALIV